MVTAITQLGCLGGYCSQRAIAPSACIRDPQAWANRSVLFCPWAEAGAIATVSSTKMG
ncbi:hypothetical protein [Nodosilinea sp. LEGE 06152]|uniref:hypothetical protein n=1 Tax=Nodosilinea sp. LEGE 06152 TaxID=2777966 RepID=UPI001882FB9F|nr:hypothetical protein [Nodosilinea sp. LEGE 06152]